MKRFVRWIETSLAVATILLSINFLIMFSDVTRFALGWAFVAGSFVLMLSRDELEREVERARKEWRVDESAGRWVGWYKIVGVEVDADGRVLFDLGGCGMLDRCWLVFESGTPAQDPRVLRRFTDRWWILIDPF